MEENKNITIMAEQQNNVLFKDACLIIDQAQSYAYRFLKGNGETANVQTILYAVRSKSENIFPLGRISKSDRTDISIYNALK